MRGILFSVVTLLFAGLPLMDLKPRDSAALISCSDASVVRGGACYLKIGCPISSPSCIDHCTDNGCSKDTKVPYQGPNLSENPLAQTLTTDNYCVDGEECTYNDTNSSLCTAPPPR